MTLLTSELQGLEFYKKYIHVILYKMLNLGFRNFRSIFLKNTFLDAVLFLYLWLCV